MAIELTSKNIRMTHAQGAAAYSKLRKEVGEAKILDRAYLYYGVLITLILVAYFGTLYLLYYSINPFAVAALSLFFGIVSIQVTGIVHDAGHRA